jgi:hypothetical protein
VARIGAVLHNSLFAAGVKDFFPSCALRRHVSQDTALNSLDVDGVFVIIALPTRTFTSSHALSRDHLPSSHTLHCYVRKVIISDPEGLSILVNGKKLDDLFFYAFHLS